MQRITIVPEIFGGKPIIRDMRISVELVLSLLAQGESPEEITTDYPGLELADIEACIEYGVRLNGDNHLPPGPTAIA